MKTFEVFPTMTLDHLQQCFTNLFPHLRINPVGIKPTPKKFWGKETIAALGGGPSHWCFEVEGNMNVAELLASLQACFGLTVRVDRWTGYTWHDTDDTRHWTLERQNQQEVIALLPESTLPQVAQ